MDHVVIPFPHPPAEHSPEFRVPSGEHSFGERSPEGAPPNPLLVGWEAPVLPYAPISPPLELMQPCWPCSKAGRSSVQRFLAVGMFQNGVYGHCTHCGDERVLPWTHTNNPSF